MSPLMQRWQGLSMRLDNLSFRERLLVFSAAVCLLFAVLYAGLIEPSLKQQGLIRAATDELNAELAPLREQLAQAERANQADQDSEAVRTAGAIAAVEKEIEALQSRMLGPSEATRLLKALLGQQTRLTLLELSTDAAQPALAPPSDISTEPGAEAGPAQHQEPFFKHGITLRAAGSYADLTAYVAQLEQMPWTVRWESVRMDATRHPRIELTVKLDSISREPAWSQL